MIKKEKISVGLQRREYKLSRPIMGLLKIFNEGEFWLIPLYASFSYQ